MMKGIVMTTLFILTIFLTVLLAHNWQGLDSEQQAFVELAAYIEDKKKNVLDEGTDSENVKTVDNKGKIEDKEAKILPEYHELALKNPDFAGWIVMMILRLTIQSCKLQKNWNIIYTGILKARPLMPELLLWEGGTCRRKEISFYMDIT